MLVAWRRVHGRKGMGCGGTAREESRGFGAGGVNVGCLLGRHDYYTVYVRVGRIQGKDRRFGSLPEGPLIEWWCVGVWV
jgi:hypothetical protein